MLFFNNLTPVYLIDQTSEAYVDQGQDYYDKQYQERIVKNLKRRAAKMGFDLTP
jgi:hypothetical protein